MNRLRLNGWQRIGVVISTVWFTSVFVWLIGIATATSSPSFTNFDYALSDNCPALTDGWYEWIDETSGKPLEPYLWKGEKPGATKFSVPDMDEIARALDSNKPCNYGGLICDREYVIPCDVKVQHAAELSAAYFAKEFKPTVRHNWFQPFMMRLALLAMAPVLLIWGTSYTLIWIVRWVVAGFRQH